MLRRENHERCAVDGVRPRGEDAQRPAKFRDEKVHVSTGRAADPVALHGPDTVRPLGEQIEAVVSELEAHRDRLAAAAAEG